MKFHWLCDPDQVLEDQQKSMKTVFTELYRVFFFIGFGWFFLFGELGVAWGRWSSTAAIRLAGTSH